MRASTSKAHKWQSSAGLTLLEGPQDTFISFQQVYLWKGELQGGESGVTGQWLPECGPSLNPLESAPSGSKMKT